MKRKVVVGGEGEKTGGKGKKMDAVDLKVTTVVNGLAVRLGNIPSSRKSN